jgi:hypothetical protein
LFDCNETKNDSSIIQAPSSDSSSSENPLTARHFLNKTALKRTYLVQARPAHKEGALNSAKTLPLVRPQALRFGYLADLSLKNGSGTGHA